MSHGVTSDLQDLGRDSCPGYDVTELTNEVWRPFSQGFHQGVTHTAPVSHPQICVDLGLCHYTRLSESKGGRDIHYTRIEIEDTQIHIFGIDLFPLDFHFCLYIYNQFQVIVHIWLFLVSQFRMRLQNIVDSYFLIVNIYSQFISSEKNIQKLDFDTRGEFGSMYIMNHIFPGIVKLPVQ